MASLCGRMNVWTYERVDVWTIDTQNFVHTSIPSYVHTERRCNRRRKRKDPLNAPNEC